MWLCNRALAAVALLALSSGASYAALVLQSELPSYTVSPDGSTTAAVKIYLAQTDGTTILTDEAEKGPLHRGRKGATAHY